MEIAIRLGNNFAHTKTGKGNNEDMGMYFISRHQVFDANTTYYIYLHAPSMHQACILDKVTATNKDTIAVAKTSDS